MIFCECIKDAFGCFFPSLRLSAGQMAYCRHNYSLPGKMSACVLVDRRGTVAPHLVALSNALPNALMPEAGDLATLSVRGPKRSFFVEKNKILIVEDEESLLRLESILLISKGYDVIGARNGQEALDAILIQRPDLVLLDIMLPEIDGFEVCSRIKSNPETEGIPVIMVTAKKTADDMARGEAVGADWYITKPFKSAMVIETIQRFLP
jgi:twitching motility two-component system response regulator PilG